MLNSIPFSVSKTESITSQCQGFSLHCWYCVSFLSAMPLLDLGLQLQEDALTEGLTSWHALCGVKMSTCRGSGGTNRNPEVCAVLNPQSISSNFLLVTLANKILKKENKNKTSVLFIQYFQLLKWKIQRFPVPEALSLFSCVPCNIHALMLP